MNSGKAILFSIYLCIAFGFYQKAHAELSTCITLPISPKPILPQTKFNELGCLEKLTLLGTPGEFIAASITVRSTQPVTDLIFRVNDLFNLNESTNAGTVDIRYVKTWYQAGDSWQNIRQNKTKRVLTPELLLHNNALIETDETAQRNYLATRSGRKIDISSSIENKTLYIAATEQYPINDSNSAEPLKLNPNTNQQVWITIRPSTSIQPGEHQGKFRIDSAQANIHIEIPISLTVYPFNLSEPDLIYSIYYRGILTSDDKGSISSENKSTAQMAAELKNMREHGIINPTIYQPPSPSTLFDNVLKLRDAAGMDNSTLYYLGIRTDTPGDISALKKSTDNFVRIQSIAKKYKTEKVLVYAIDEADLALVPKQKPMWSKYKTLGADIFAADWKPGSESYYAGEISTLILGSEPNKTVNRFLRTKGTQTFLYNRPQVGLENPYIYRLQYGITAWKNDFSGVMNYAYQHSMGDIWNDFDHPEFRDHVFAYPTTDGVIDTIAWEGFREAVVDVKYISTLNKLANLSGSTADIQYLAKLKSSGAEDLDSMRKDIAMRITSLCQKLDPQTASQSCLSFPPAPISSFEIKKASD